MSNPYQSSRPDESHMPPRQPPKPTDASEYLCGGELFGPYEPKLTADCGAKTQIKMGELIRCRECGHRVMYKPRTHKSECSQRMEAGLGKGCGRDCAADLRREVLVRRVHSWMCPSSGLP